MTEINYYSEMTFWEYLGVAVRDRHEQTRARLSGTLSCRAHSSLTPLFIPRMLNPNQS